MLSKTRLLLSLGQNTVLRRAAPVQILSGGNGNDTRRYNKEASKVIEKSEADSSYSKFVEPVPIDHLDITHNIEKVQKNGSLFNGYVLGEWDKDLINFPFLLKNRKEFLHVNDQYEMIRNSWNKISKTDESLNGLGYRSLHKMSVSEMINIFEAIGASMEKEFAFGTREDEEIRHDKKMSRTMGINFEEKRIQVNERAFESFNSLRMNLEAVMPILIHNSLVHYSFNICGDEERKLMLSQDNSKIGFAVCESHVNHSSDYHEWNSKAVLTSDRQAWIINGSKCNVLAADFDKYLISLKTTDFLEVQKFNEKSNEGIVMLLVPKEELTFEEDYQDAFGNKYQKISFANVKIDRQTGEVIKAQQDISDFLNIKGCGMMASSALLLGMMKQLLKNTYAHLINEKLGLTNCEIVQYKLYQATAMIYSVESMLYMTAAMYDCFEKGANFEGETSAIKVLATEYSYQVFQELRTIFGSRYPFLTTSLETISSLDSIFECSLQTRMKVGEELIRKFQESPLFRDRSLNVLKSPVYSVQVYLRNRRLRNRTDRLTREMSKYVHHYFHDSCDWIESSMNRLQSSTEAVLNEHHFKTMSKHNDLNRVCIATIDIFKMISVLSRANHSFTYGLANTDAEKELCIAICKETFLKHLQLFEDMDRSARTDNDAFAQDVYKANLKANGYFASLFRS